MTDTETRESKGPTDPLAELARWVKVAVSERDKLIRAADRAPDGLQLAEAATPLTINGMRAVDFIRRAYDLGTDLNGPGRYDQRDPIQSELRHIKGWIEMAEHDALHS